MLRLQQFEFIVTNYKLNQVLDQINTIYLEPIGLDFFIKATTINPENLKERLGKLSIPYNLSEVMSVEIDPSIAPRLVEKLIDRFNAELTIEYYLKPQLTQSRLVECIIDVRHHQLDLIEESLNAYVKKLINQLALI